MFSNGEIELESPQQVCVLRRYVVDSLFNKADLNDSSVNSFQSADGVEQDADEN